MRKIINIEMLLLILLIIVCSYQSIIALKIPYLDEILIMVLALYEIFMVFLGKKKIKIKIIYYHIY